VRVAKLVASNAIMSFVNVNICSAAGIPKFYRWLSERYPLLNMSVTATDAPPEIDNLYLDMNGIIHNCTHANDPNLKLTETEMIVRIFSYLDKLIQIVKPKKLIFMAIDGKQGRLTSSALLLDIILTEVGCLSCRCCTSCQDEPTEGSEVQISTGTPCCKFNGETHMPSSKHDKR
jgi:hypothetical protein